MKPLVVFFWNDINSWNEDIMEIAFGMLIEDGRKS